MTLLQSSSLSCYTNKLDMFQGIENTCCVYMLHKPYFISNQLWNKHSWVCCILMFQAKQYINDMNDAQAYEMQVQMWKLNTWGVTVSLWENINNDTWNTPGKMLQWYSVCLRNPSYSICVNKYQQDGKILCNPLANSLVIIFTEVLSKEMGL
jgi:hypothetical protein